MGPGLNVTIESVTVPEDLRPEVVFTAKDDRGNDVDVSEFDGARSVRFGLAYLEGSGAAKSESSPAYVSYIRNASNQGTTDGAAFAGVTENDDGSFTYKFQTALPAEYDPSATHLIAGQFSRWYFVDGKSYPANAALEFRPDGDPVTVTRDVSSTETCNKCHTRLGVHGGSRRELKYCQVCHDEGTINAQTGHSVYLPELIHKIHMGEQLPSVEGGTPYQIITSHGTADFSTVAFPQDIRNCAVCHQDGPQAEIYLTRPTRAGCGACHDRTWFGDPSATPEGFENHPFDFNQPTDSGCVGCHPATGPGVAPISEVHKMAKDFTPGLKLNITHVATAAGPAPGGIVVTITFTMTDGADAPITDPTAAGASIGAIMAWPATDYQDYVAASNITAAATIVNNGDGSYVYTFANPVNDSAGSYAVAMQGRISFQHDGETLRTGTTSNGLTFFQADGSPAEPRRTVVTDAKCMDCHEDIRAHGEQRFGVGECLLCHNVNENDLAYRNDSDEVHQKVDAVTVNFKDMIHRIHTGEELQSADGYTVIGYQGTPYDFTEVRFPGDRRQCTICHEEGTYGLPLPAEASPTTVDNTVTEPVTVLAARAACTSCHDSLITNVHAILMTEPTMGVETCVTCHGDLSEMHQIEP